MNQAIAAERTLVAIIVQDLAGKQCAVEAEPGVTLMEAIRDSVGELMALCGGCCSCGTCHVHIDPAFLAVLPPMTEEENDLLDGSAHRDERSRLSCQIPITAELDGLRVAIAPE